MIDDPSHSHANQLSQEALREFLAQERAQLDVALRHVETLLDHQVSDVSRSRCYCQALAALNLALAALIEAQQTANALLAAHLQDIMTARPE